MNGSYHLLAYADGINLLGDNINTIKNNIEALIDASKEVDIEVNTQKTAQILQPVSCWFLAWFILRP
jgi:hypothetical protein